MRACVSIAHDGQVREETYAALKDLKESGRRLILVTGRELEQLKETFPGYKLFDRIVAENGASIYDPDSNQERTLAPPPVPEFVAELKRRNVEPLSVGNCILATWEPHETAVIETIRDLGLELQIIFNKGAIMILPAGVNKASGFRAALSDLELSAHNAVAVGDAENDHAFLSACGCAAAVANALPALKEAADIVLTGKRGDGVIELIELILADEERLLRSNRHAIRLGTDRAGNEVHLQPNRGAVLIAGTSGTGKSTIATALTERMVEGDFEFCVFDPEGDYQELEHAIPVGGPKTPPSREEALRLLWKAGVNVVINTQALEVSDRPPFFASLFPQISSLRAQTGRPHWLLIDEAHHLLPARREGLGQVMPEELSAAILITVHPEAVAIEVLRTVKTVLAVGAEAGAAVLAFCKTAGIEPPTELPKIADDEVLFYSTGGAAIALKPQRCAQARKRHVRKYAEGELGPDRSFYFRGPDNALNLRAQNLKLFLQIAAGVDDETWEFHRRAGHYSDWFRRAIKNEDLARGAAEIESGKTLDAKESRERIAEAVSSRYTAPVTPESD